VEPLSHHDAEDTVGRKYRVDSRNLCDVVQVGCAERVLHGRSHKLVLAVAVIILFILAEDMTRPMVFTNNWTIIYAVMALIGTIALALIIRKDKKSSEDEESIHESGALR
jgi:hypothetical protein